MPGYRTASVGCRAKENADVAIHRARCADAARGCARRAQHCGNLGDSQAKPRGLHHHFAGKFHTSGAQLQILDGVLCESAQSRSENHSPGKRKTIAPGLSVRDSPDNGAAAA